MAACTALLALAGCIAGGADAPPEGEIPFETLDYGQQSGIEDEQTRTIHDQNEWETLYQEHAPDEAPPEIDFDETIVLAAFKGQSPDGCHGAEITNVTGIDDDTIQANVDLFEITNMFCHQAVTYPYHIIAIDRYDATVEYDIQHTQREAEDR